MSRCVVTGGSGRLGRTVVATLADAGHDVVSVDVVSIDVGARDGLPADERCLDLRDRDAVAALFGTLRPDAVVHLAGVAVPFSLPDPEIFAANTALLYSVIEAAERSGTGALLVASSPTVVGYGNPRGWSPRSLPIDEGHPLEPWHGYASSKQAMEMLVVAAARRNGDACHYGVFRPCYVIAPEEWRGAPTQQGHTVAERLADPALSAPALFNYVDARDAGEFVLAWLAAAGEIPNATCFFVGANDALATGPLAELLPRHVPGIGDTAAGLTGDLPAFDCSRAARLLGWTARRSWRTELTDKRGLI